MNIRWFSALIAMVGCGLARPVIAGEPVASLSEAARRFEMHVRPVLATRCVKCHGPDKQQGALRVDTREALLAGGDNGSAIVPGDASASLLIQAVRYDGREMPPDEPLSEAEVDALTAWVAAGAPWPEGIELPADNRSRITQQDRAHWAFQPVRAVEPPSVDDAGWARTEIDRFVLARLVSTGLGPSPEADRLTLLRRATFDLTGLPPSPEEISTFLSDEAPDAYERLIDRLLDSPRYGERWARHWLDLVRYAESDGYKQDAYRPHAWRYRDYVVRSFNDDKPYDRFAAEQLAGDEVAPDDLDARVATGYLRLWIYEYNQRDVRTQWTTILNDLTDVTADVFLGMGLSCARCHDHKFDPLLQRDYYRLQAFFAPLAPRDDLPLATASQLAEQAAALAVWDERAADVKRQLAEIEAPFARQAADRAINKFPPDIRPMLRKAAAERSPLERQLAELADRQVHEELRNLDVLKQLPDGEKPHYEELRKQLDALKQERPAASESILGATDIGPVAPLTFIPGDRQQTPIEPGFLSVLEERPAVIEIPTAANTTGRRAALARWIGSADNPLSTRVIVNRVWQQHFGRGLVASSSDFGRLGEPPSHPELLDWLTTRFVADGWRLKPLHRRIMTSAAYRQASVRAAPELARRIDPDNRLLWRMNPRRLEAEQIRDALLAASGELDLAAGGPGAEVDAPRRSIYLRVIRNQRHPLLAAFDGPDGFGSVAQRYVTTTPTQALLMINGPWPLDRARALAGRLQREGGDTPGMLALAFRLAWGRDGSRSCVIQLATGPSSRWKYHRVSS
jgi:mono/diheme cytochrome c family protein